MRVVVYVPSASTRARRALAADTTRAGHDIAGFATTAHDATWGLAEWRADRIAGRDHDLLQLVQDQPDLADRVLGIRPTRRAKAALLIPAGWLAWWRRHRWTTTAAAGVAAAALVAALTIGGEDRRPDAAPAPVVTGSAPPSSSPPASRRPTGPPPPVSVPPNGRQTPRTTPVRDTGTRPARAVVEESTAPRTTPPPAPASPAPSDVAEPTPGTTTPPADQPAARCVVDLRLIVLRVRLCLDRSAH